MKFLVSLRSRLWFSYALLIFVALGVVLLVLMFYLIRSPLLYRSTLVRLKVVGTVALNRQDELVGQALERTLTRASENFDLRFLLFDQRGNLLYDTQADLASIAIPRLGALRSSFVLRDDRGQAWLYSLVRLDSGERLMVATPRSSIRFFAVLRDELLPPFLFSAGMAFVLSLLLAFGMARWIADPLQGMLTAARAMPARVNGVSVQGPREVQELTSAFNKMVARVQDTQRSQREFVANVSHELKTPLTSIQGFAQALLDGTADTPESRQQAAQVIYDEAGRMHRMALELLDLARFDAGIIEMEFLTLDLAIILQNTVEKFAPQARQKNISLTIETNGDLEIHGDGDRLAQVFTNLVDNALEHTPEGGSIEIIADDYGAEKHIEIRDTGVGIPREALPYIFERFYQVDPARSRQSKDRSGLGLAIVKEIVLAHGGKINVHSEVGVGTTFSLILPLLII